MYSLMGLIPSEKKLKLIFFNRFNILITFFLETADIYKIVP